MLFNCASVRIKNVNYITQHGIENVTQTFKALIPKWAVESSKHKSLFMNKSNQDPTNPNLLQAKYPKTFMENASDLFKWHIRPHDVD